MPLASKLKVLILDNYDSFTYNLVHYVEKYCDEVEVYRNDEIDLEKVNEYDKIIISPGPGLPKQAGITLNILKKYVKTKSILGVCLGHQAIVEAFGGCLVNLSKVYHGVSSKISILSEDKIFKNLPPAFNVGRYHSWVVDKTSFPKQLLVTAVDEENNIMAVKHKYLDITGVQFHPESVLTEYGEEMIKNWIYN